MAELLVVGATGVLGHHVAEEAEAAGHGVQRTSRAQRIGESGWSVVTLARGRGIRDAVKGVDAIIHCAAAPFTRAEQATEAGAMQRLRAAAPEARILYPSIVGIERIQAFRYYRTKLAAEEALAAAGGDHAIVRFTQFHEFADRFAAMPVPTFPRHFSFQSLAAVEAARELVRLVDAPDQGLVGDFGGPEVHPLRQMVRDRLRHDGKHKLVLELPMGRVSKAFKAGLNLCPGATQGKITWAEHLTG